MAVVVKCVPPPIDQFSLFSCLLDSQQYCEHPPHWHLATFGRVAQLEHVHANAEQRRLYVRSLEKLLSFEPLSCSNICETALTRLFPPGMQGHLEDIKKVWKLLVGLGVQVRNNTEGALPYPYKPQVRFFLFYPASCVVLRLTSVSLSRVLSQWS
jgi:hypothetical protein